MYEKDLNKFVELLNKINNYESNILQGGVYDEDAYFIETQQRNDEVMKYYKEAEEIRMRLATVGINCYKYYREVVENE